MSQPYDGGPAFSHGGSQYSSSQRGMTLRDWFAGQAISGYLAGRFASGKGMSDEVTGYAAGMYEIADAMIAAREAKQ